MALVYNPLTDAWVDDATGAAYDNSLPDPAAIQAVQGGGGSASSPASTSGIDWASVLGTPGSSTTTTSPKTTSTKSSSSSSGGGGGSVATGTWTIHTAPDGSLFEVNSLTGETQAITGAGSGTPPASNHYSVVTNPDGSTSLLNTDTGDITFLAPPAVEAPSTPRYQYVKGADGNYYAFDPVTGTTTPIAGGAGSAASTSNPGGYYVNSAAINGGGATGGNTYNITGSPYPTGSGSSSGGGNSATDQAALMNAQTNQQQLAFEEEQAAATNRLNAASQLANVINSTDPAALPAFLAAGGGNIFNAIHSGATALDNTALAPAAAILDKYGFTPNELLAAGITPPSGGGTTGTNTGGSNTGGGNTTSSGGTDTTGGNGGTNPGGPMQTTGGPPAAHQYQQAQGPTVPLISSGATTPMGGSLSSPYTQQYGTDLSRMIGGKYPDSGVKMLSHYDPANFAPTLAAAAVTDANLYHQLTGQTPKNIEPNGSLNPYLNPDGSANYAAFAPPNPYTGNYQPYDPHAGLDAKALASLPVGMQTLQDQAAIAANAARATGNGTITSGNDVNITMPAGANTPVGNFGGQNVTGPGTVPAGVSSPASTGAQIYPTGNGTYAVIANGAPSGPAGPAVTPVATVPSVAADSAPPPPPPQYNPSDATTYSGVPAEAVHPGFTSVTTGSLGPSTLGDYGAPGEKVFAHSANGGQWVQVQGPPTTPIPGGADIGIGMPYQNLANITTAARGGMIRGLSIVNDSPSGRMNGHEEMVYAPNGGYVLNHGQTVQALGGGAGLRAALQGNHILRRADGGPIVAGTDTSTNPYHHTYTGMYGSGGTSNTGGGTMQPPPTYSGGWDTNSGGTTTSGGSGLPLGLPASAYQSALQLRTTSPYPQLDPYDVGFGFLPGTLQQSYEKGLQDQYGVNASDVAQQIGQYAQQGLRTGYGLTLGELAQGQGY